MKKDIVDSLRNSRAVGFLIDESLTKASGKLWWLHVDRWIRIGQFVMPTTDFYYLFAELRTLKASPPVCHML